MNDTTKRAGTAIWTHLRSMRDTYLYLPVGALFIYVAIRCVNHLTGRAVVDDPGAIVSGLYNAFLVLCAAAITGALQGFLIPDPVVREEYTLPDGTKDKREIYPSAWIHTVNVFCTIVVFALALWFIFK